MSKADRRAYHNAYSSARCAARKSYLARYKAERGCADCGIRNPVVLEFAHRNPAVKRDCVGSMLMNSMAVIEAEIAKCDVLCANCHIIRDQEPLRRIHYGRHKKFASRARTTLTIRRSTPTVV